MVEKHGSRWHLRQELDEEFENPEFHAKYGSAWRGDVQYRQGLLDAKKWMYRDVQFLRTLSQDSFFTGYTERMAKTEALRKMLEQRQELTKARKAKEERERVARGEPQRGPVKDAKALEEEEREEALLKWIDSFRPPGIVTQEERDMDKFMKKREQLLAEREAELQRHRDFIAKMQEVDPELKREIDEGRDELLEQAARQAAEAAGGPKAAPKGAGATGAAAAGAAGEPTASAAAAAGETSSSIPGRSTALVVGPEPTAWQKWKASLPSFRRSRLFQRSLEFKESLEESQNPMVAKTMDTVGAAADVASRVVNKIRGGSETANALGRLKAAWPHFDQVTFWKTTVRRLPRIARAFHERDFEWIKENCSPQMFDILCHKSDELCKSPNFPTKFFYSFIVRPPKSAEIITCVTDDPMRPYMMLRFSLQKTVEKIEPPPPPLGDPTQFRFPLNYTHWVLAQDGVDMEKVKRVLPPDYELGIPGQGISERAWHLFRQSMRRIGKKQNKYGRINEDERLKAALKDCKVVRAIYVMVLQYDPERDKWLVHNFEQAIMDLTF